MPTSAGCETTGTLPPLTSSVLSFLHPLAGAEWKISETPPPSTSSTLLPLHPLTSAEYESIETPLSLQSMMTIDADMELDDDDVVLQDLNVPALLSSSQLPPQPLMMNHSPESGFPQLPIIPQKHKYINLEGPQNLKKDSLLIGNHFLPQL